MKAIAPGKLILSGEHAAVYGRPALAMAIDRSAVAVLTPEGAMAEGEVAFDLHDLEQQERFTIRALRDFRQRIQRNYEMFLNGELGIRQVLRKPIDLFEYAFIMLLDGLHLKLEQKLSIRLESNIPIGCGLGSSAASILSVLRAIGHYFRVDFRPDWYYEYSLEAERLQHGFPSGVDSYISIHGGCVRFQGGRAERLPLPRGPFPLVNTGTPTCTTGESVAAVRRRFEHSGVWDDFEEVTRRMEEAVRRNDREALQQAVRDNQRLLSVIAVEPEKVRLFIDEIERAGGAAKICGAGAAEGDTAGMMMVVADRPPRDLCAKFGFTLESVRGEPLGVRIV